ncbi:MBL fold metallo-hydrolase [Flagellimonas algicola]|uniref:MBL fold metallo-hydrolase n=1 Tax=Flagellimonas algicola TaxID=2583815 RepID=A0ABY2WQW8_9FLAO|nr:MBL fold metallo-hydrolase [Allomuricauda algicola]TMU57390.1 MBL fold metallo-hydrolase [Allomuricauda algicola]
MKYWLALVALFLLSCKTQAQQHEIQSPVSLIVLGTVQDGGSPHIGCKRDCCAELFQNPDPERKVVSLGLVDHENQKTYLFEATPDMSTQLKVLKTYAGLDAETPTGIFLTHAHIGHYTGLMYLGREALGAKQVPIYAMPKMKAFLENNGPWNQLVALGNIGLEEMIDKRSVELTSHLTVIPFTVPHRDEFSETVGFKIIGPTKSVLFIPDIDKWKKWDESITEQIRNVDLAFLDASFFDSKEINNRDIAEIPHPFVIESMELFASLPASEKEKIHFIHFNHTNPLLDESSEASQSVRDAGYKVARFHQKIGL